MEKVKQLCKAKSVAGTSLITMYLEAKSMWLVTDRIKQELKTVSNIKDKLVGKLVTQSLKMIQHQLKMLKTIPQNGIVLCSGNYVIKDSYV